MNLLSARPGQSLRSLIRLSWIALLLLALSSVVQAGAINISTWLDTSVPTAGYHYSINDNTAGRFTFSITVNQLDADIFAIAFNTNGLAEYSLVNIDIQNFNSVRRSGSDVTGTPVIFFNTANCGPGCNLNGLLTPPLPFDVILRIGSSGSPLTDWFYDISFDIDNLGLALADFTYVGVRGQSVLGSNNSDKASQGITTLVPEPAFFVILALALFGFSWRQRSH